MASRQRTSRRRSKGQSLPLIALMIVVLVAMVGLSVDVGNTFQEERQAVSAANAASLAGMNTVIRKVTNTRNRQVYDSIVASLQANGVNISADGIVSDGQLRLNAVYIDAQGKPIGSILPEDSVIPNDIGYVQVRLEGIVDTYFAQVVGRNDLPINATSYAGQCPLGDGVYPIAVDQTLLDNNGTRFAPPQPLDADGDGVTDDDWRVLQSGPYKGSTARKIYVHDGSNQPGNFGFMRWEEAKDPNESAEQSAGALGASLTGFGNLAAGFEEAPEALIGGAAADPNYPIRPGELNEGDWVYGTSGWKHSGQGDPIADHIAVGTRMVLPIYDVAIGNGNSQNDPVRFRVTGFGSFVILSQNDAQNPGPNGKKFFEMVYLGPATRMMTACQVSAVPPNPGDCCELWGDVSLMPEYAIIPNDSQPVQYMVVLDQSGSMSANFNGQCNQDGSRNPSPPARNFDNQPSAFWQCANGPMYDTKNDGDSVADTTVTDRVTNTGVTYVWGDRDERRITVAKKALETLIRQTNMPGNTAYTTAYPDDQMGLVWFTDTVQRNGNNEVFVNGKNLTNDPNELVTKMWARTTGSDIYRTQGGTNGAAGLYRAGLILDGAPKTVVHTNGKTYEYKQVVLFITDGVSNQFFHESRTDLRVTQSSWDTYPNGNPCRNLGGLAIEDAECQTTRVGGVFTTTVSINGRNTSVGLQRPVSQAIEVSQGVLQANGYAVFVIALSDLPATGLADGIPSFSHYYKAVPALETYADGSTNVDQIVKDINGIVESDRCQPGKDTSEATTMTSTQFEPVPLPNGTTLTYPNVGRVTVRSTTSSVSYSTNIVVDDADGSLSYRFAKVPPGIYTLTAVLYYKHPLEPPGISNRAYEGIWDGTGSPKSISVEVSSSARSGSFLPSTQQDLQMRLVGNVCNGF